MVTARNHASNSRLQSLKFNATQVATDDNLDEHQQKLINEKRKEFENAKKHEAAAEDNDFPDGAQLCLKCNTKAMIKMDGCMTCLNGGDSRCG